MSDKGKINDVKKGCVGLAVIVAIVIVIILIIPSDNTPAEARQGLKEVIDPYKGNEEIIWIGYDANTVYVGFYIRG